MDASNGVECASPRGPWRPPELEHLIDSFNFLLTASDQVVPRYERYVHWWTEKRRIDAMHEQLDDSVRRQVPQEINTLPALGQFKKQREARLSPSERPFTHYLDSRDDLIFQVREWRRHLDATRDAIQPAQQYIDGDKSDPMTSWTYGLNRLLRAFGGLINRSIAVDCPSKLDTERFEVIRDQLHEKFLELMAIVPRLPKPLADNVPNADLVARVESVEQQVLIARAESLAQECPLEARLAMKRIARACGESAVRTKFQEHQRRLVRWREPFKPDTPEYDAVQREIESFARHGFEWQPERTPYDLLSEQVTMRTEQAAPSESARRWKVVSLFLLLSRERPPSLDTVPLLSRWHSAGDLVGRMTLLHRLQQTPAWNALLHHVNDALAKLEPRNSVDRLRDELAALDYIPRLYWSLYQLEHFLHDQAIDVQNLQWRLAVSTALDLAQRLANNWPCGASDTIALQARDREASLLLTELGLLEQSKQISSVGVLQRARAMLKAGWQEPAEWPFDTGLLQAEPPNAAKVLATPLPDAASLTATRVSDSFEDGWRDSVWVIGAVRELGNGGPKDFGKVLRKYAARIPRPDGVRKCKDSDLWEFDIEKLTRVRKFSAFRAMLMDAMNESWAPKEQRKPRGRRKTD